jgi:hypothetical protein
MRRGRFASAGRGRWTLLAGVGGCALLAAAILAQTQPKPGTTQKNGRAVNGARTNGSATAVKPAERRPLAYYTSGVRTDMFTAPGAAEPVVKPEPPKPVVVAQPEIIDPFADYSYTGTILMGDQTLALIENSKTKEGLYVKSGDQFMGGTVSDVSDKSVTIAVAGSPRTLRKTEDYKLTPLDKNAPYMTGAQQGQPGAMGPGGMRMGGPGGMMPGMAGGPGGGFGMMQNLPPDVQQRIQQRFQGMSPEQMQNMRNRFMNRSFEGGGGGRRRRFF